MQSPIAASGEDLSMSAEGPPLLCLFSLSSPHCPPLLMDLCCFIALIPAEVWACRCSALVRVWPCTWFLHAPSLFTLSHGQLVPSTMTGGWRPYAGVFKFWKLQGSVPVRGGEAVSGHGILQELGACLLVAKPGTICLLLLLKERAGPLVQGWQPAVSWHPVQEQIGPAPRGRKRSSLWVSKV